MGASRSLGQVPLWIGVLVWLLAIMPQALFAANHNVTVGPSGLSTYSPDDITIARGDSVTFSWASICHSVTYVSGPISWVDSGIHDPTFTFVLPNGTNTTVFQTAGTYTYDCACHGPIMSGTVRVVDHFLVSAPATGTAGVGFTVNVSARDASNALLPFNGTVQLSISNPHPDGGELPATTTLSGGTGSFTVTPKRSGLRTITVTANLTTGSDTVDVDPAPASELVLVVPGTVSSGVSFQATVTARDPFENIADNYTGKVQFTSSDLDPGTSLPNCSAPADCTLTNGSRSFNVTLATPGPQTLTVTDKANGALTDFASINVSAACSVTFSNTAAITINDLTTATDYPSNIAVGGLKQTVTGLAVTINGLNHTFGRDIDMLLVGPGGQKMVILSDSGGNNTVTDATITLADSAASLLPDVFGTTLVSGTFKPTNNVDQADVFPAPAPAGPYANPARTGTATLASTFGGINPNGTWSLYITDDQGGGGGSISGGWSLTFSPPPNTFCNQTAISIPTVGASAPYPSDLQVSNLDGTIKNVSVRLDKLNKFLYPSADFDMLLVGPAGGKLIILSDVGAGGPSNAVVTLDNSGAATPATLGSGIFVPSNVGVGDTFSAPAPAGPYSDPALGANFSIFNGTNPNGTWKLYVVDDEFHPCVFPCFFPEFPGSIAGGWALTFDVIYNTTTALGSSLNPSEVGPAVTLTATVTSSGGTPTGTVTFKLDGSTLNTVPLMNGTASLGVEFFASTFNLTATYNGDANFHPSTSPTLVQVVNPGPTTTTVASSLNPSTFGQNVTFTATIRDLSGFLSPTGTVTFKDGATPLGTSPVSVATSTATLTTAAVSGGSRSITATYNGNSNFQPSTSSVLTQTVNKATSSTVVVSSSSTSTYGTSITFTATVSESTPGTPTGTVTFKDGATIIGTGTLSGSPAVASTMVSSLTAAGSPHSITAVYNGDGNFNGSTSSAITQTVNKATPTASVISFQNPSVFTQDVPFRADVLGTGVTPTGTVTFKDGAATLGTIAVTDGIALFNTAALSGGNHNISVEYNGDSNYNTVTSPILVQEVLAAETFTDLTTSGTPSTFGQTVTFTATVTSFVGTPVGTVTFKDGEATVGSSPLNGAGIANFLTSALPAGSHSIIALYNSNGDFSSSTSGPLTQTVNQAATTVMLSGTKETSGFREAVTFTVTVSSTTSGTPTGSVTLLDSGTIIGSGSLSDGQAQFTVSGMTIGRHEITVQYDGDLNFPANNSLAPLVHYRSPRPRAQQ